jgi:YVTN family beta-propeller protein
VGWEPYSAATSPCLNKVYVTNWSSDTVSVIDVGTLTVTKEIGGLDGPRDIVISPYGHRAYVSNQSDDSIGVIDTINDRLIAVWPIGGSWLSGLDISPDGSTLYVADRYGQTRAVDTSSGRVITSIPTENTWDVEVFPAAAGPFAYVSNVDYRQVTVLDTSTNSITGTILLPPASGPRGLALFPPSTTCLHGLSVLLHPPSSEKGWTPGTSLVYTETLYNVTGATDSFTLTLSGNVWTTTLSITNTGSIADMTSVDFSVQVDIPAGATPGDIDVVTITATSLISPTVYSDTATITTTAFSGQYGYVFNPNNEEINVVDTVFHIDTGVAIDTSPYDTGSGTWPWRGALSPDGQWLYASLDSAQQVLVISTTTHTPAMTMTVGDGPHGIAFTADGDYAFVANQDSDTVSVIDTSGSSVTATIPVSDNPVSIATNPCLDKVYVTSFVNPLVDNGVVSVIDVGTLTVTKVIFGFSDPRDIVISPYGFRAYVSNTWDGSIGVINTINDSLITSWSIGGSALAGLDISPDGNTLYAADRWEGVTYAIDTSSGQIIATIPTSTGDSGSWGVEVVPAAGGPCAYVSNVDDQQVLVLDTNTNSVTTTISLSGGPRGLALFPTYTSCDRTYFYMPLTTRNYP